MPDHRRVALIIESSRGYGRGLLKGIARYVQTFGPWAVFCQDRRLGERTLPWLRRWRGDGIIVRAESPAMERAILQKGVPAVNLRGLREPKLPLLESDGRAVARLACEHLLQRGFRHFGYCGFGGMGYSERRPRSFLERLAGAGYPCRVHAPRERVRRASQRRREQHGLRYEKDLMKWVPALPKPVGVMACTDLRGQQLVSAAREIGVAVPEEMAVGGVDNDVLPCELSDPPLSSVEPDTERIGFEAAALLDGMTDDRLAAEAIRFIRHRACEGIRVRDVLAHVPMTHVTLKRRFEKFLGRTPKAEILRVQLGRVMRLLADTNLSQSEIARLAGFKYAEYLATLFKEKSGQTLGEYRASHRGPGHHQRPPGHVQKP